eukprot:CAMPEP_0116859890 /NCGR_PEP_ID=MMETSP0418-20121206/22091_1 /TAXON_ID=1158023 /ORGANISM="Astrosyne radiata, Strain 13vi08-1A" /LENGTH=308 /DNA_ID=CAMNT_0004494197 /DNA_START=50 /DNA_END=977 /DNA_ORIENTATION=-
MSTRKSADVAVGIMDSHYFTGRKELLDFFNELLDLNLSKIEQTASGAVACQLTDYIFPGSIPMNRRVNWEAKSEYEYVQNYKLLQAAFSKYNVKRYVDVTKLIKAKYQDNLEFCQWLKAFFDQSGVHREDYDAAAVRAKGKGANKVHEFLDRTASSHNSKAVPRTTRSTTTPKFSSSSRSTPSSSNNKATTRSNVGSGLKENAKKGSVHSAVADAELMKKNSELTTKVQDLETTLGDVEKERDFYFEKLRNVEIMLQVHQEKGAASDPGRLVDKIFKVLYAAAEDNIAVDDDGEFIDSPGDDLLADAL